MHASLDREIGGIEVVGVQAAGAIRVFWRRRPDWPSGTGIPVRG